MKHDLLEQKLDELGQKLAPHESLVPRVMEAVRGISMERPSQPQLGKWIMRISIGLAACAAFAIGLIPLLSRPHTTWADVLDKVNQTHTLSFEIHDGSSINGRGYMRGDFTRTEWGKTLTAIWNRSTGKLLSLDSKQRAATLMTTNTQSFDLYSMLKEFKDGTEEHLPDQELDGRKVEVFHITRKMPDASETSKPKVLTLWVDPATGLPVRMENPQLNGVITIDKLKFDVDLSDQLFDMTIPPNYRFFDEGGLTASQLKPAPTTREAEGLVLTAKGIGPLKFGDAEEKVIAVLGKPEEILPSGSLNDFRYPSKGLFVLVDSRVGLMKIRVYGKQTTVSATNSFPGKTDRGIAMGASRAQIEAAYGKPAKVTILGSFRVILEYKTPKLTFELYNDQLGQIDLDSR